MSKDMVRRSTKIAVGFAGKNEIEEFIGKLDHIQNKDFEKYIIAYIDFLGMTNRMRQKNSFDSLHILKFILSRAKKNAAFITGINTINDFEIKVFSDNVVIAQRVKKEKLSDQIIGVINLVSLIQFEAFFQFDYPLRGGITIGELFIDDSIVWGTGLIEAYHIENNIANYPRVIVSSNLISTYEKCEEKTINIFALIKEDIDGLWFVDYLMAAPNVTLIPEISASLADKAAQHANEDERIKQKINWIISYFNALCRQMKDRGDYEQYCVPYI